MPGGARPQLDLGQNFLVDEASLAAEIGYAQVTSADTVLEVGAGPGNLTGRLAARAGRVVAVEYDRRFRDRLDALARQHGNIELIWGDALAVRLPAFTKVVANLPYRVALPLIMRLLDQEFDSGVLIVQEDMAQKICAGPGEAGYGRVSVTVQRMARAELLQVVPRQAFSPPPSVDSAMMRLSPVGEPFPVGSAPMSRHCCRAGCAPGRYPRSLLRSSARSAGSSTRTRCGCPRLATQPREQRRRPGGGNPAPGSPRGVRQRRLRMLRTAGPG
jgi:ribosomal RNA small subunit methyltransferase A